MGSIELRFEHRHVAVMNLLGIQYYHSGSLVKAVGEAHESYIGTEQEDVATTGLICMHYCGHCGSTEDFRLGCPKLATEPREEPG